MGHIPSSCVTCPFENSCNTAMSFSDCHFYYARKEEQSFMARLKKLFGKVFR